MRAGVLTVIIVVVCSLSAHAADPLSVALCPRVTEAPVIDGTLDDAAWEDAEALRPFGRHDGTGTALEQTEVTICSDGEALFIGFVLHESQMDSPAAEATEHNSSAIFRQDAVEIFISPDLAQGQRGGDFSHP